MNTLVERIKHHQDAGHAQRTATRRNPSIAALLVCGIALALMMTACFSPSPTRPPSTATPVPSGMVDAHSTTLPTSTSPAPTPRLTATVDSATSTPSGIPAQDKTISQVKKGEITIDGDLADWAEREWLAVSSYYNGRLQAPSPDLDVKASFAFDSENLYLAVKAVDDDVQKVDRSWRYGDGFLFTLVTDEGKERSSYVRQFAFDQESKFLIFGNGEYFPPFDMQNVEFQFRQHDLGVDYEIAIPLKLLKPFSPFIYEKVALNLVYTDRDSAAGGTTVMLYPDADFDTERSRIRAGEFFALKTADPETTQDASYHATLGKNFFRDGETIELRYAVNADKSQDRTGISAALLRDGVAIQQAVETVDLHPGLNQGTLSAEHRRSCHWRLRSTNNLPGYERQYGL